MVFAFTFSVVIQNCKSDNKTLTSWTAITDMLSRALFSITVLTGFLCGHPVQGKPDDREKISFFEKSVRPILIKHCVQCHGQEKQESGLRVEQIESMLKGGDTGPALIPGKPDESLIVDAIEYSSDLEMPPSKNWRITRLTPSKSGSVMALTGRRQLHPKNLETGANIGHSNRSERLSHRTSRQRAIGFRMKLINLLPSDWSI